MSGGIAYVLDQDNTLYRKINKGMVNMVHVTSKYDILELQGMIEEHVKHTGSEIGQEIIDHFEEYLPFYPVSHNLKILLIFPWFTPPIPFRS